MPRRHRHRLLRALHASLMLVLALCLAGQPLLAAVGEVHEATSHAATAASHDDHVVSHDAGTEQDRDDGTLHMLLHYAHCCGHNVGLAAAAPSTPDAPPSSQQRLPPVISHVATAPLNSPFRPPIQA